MEIGQVRKEKNQIIKASIIIV